MSKPECLNGWKQIGEYLGCGPKVAATYEKDGLPVYRYRGRVRAFRGEVTAWLRKHARNIPKITH